jgi:hypothetical protein
MRFMPDPFSRRSAGSEQSFRHESETCPRRAAEHQLGADGPQRTLFGYTQRYFLWAAAQAQR